MNRPSRPSRTPARLSESTNRHLNMYAIAASAAGVGLLALAQPAEAKIVYTPASVKIVSQPAGIYNLDLDHDGRPDFALIDSHVSTSSGHFANFFVEPGTGKRCRRADAQRSIPIPVGSCAQPRGTRRFQAALSPGPGNDGHGLSLLGWQRSRR